MTTKSAYHHGDLRNALLDAADSVLQAQGLQGFTLRACARQAGVSHTAPQHHFGDVRGLLRALAERGFQRLVDRLRTELVAAGAELEAQMFATARAYVEFAQSYPEHFRIMFRSDLIDFDMADPPDPVLQTFTELTNVILRQRGDAPIAVQDVIADKPPALVNDILVGWCHVHGYAHLALEGQLTMVAEDDQLAHLEQSARRLSKLIQGR
ncbi:MAG: TetR/AcrR family transcriptional regulator [bacterium]